MAKKGKEKERKGKLIESFFVKLPSLNELARNAWLGDSTRPVYAVKNGNSYRLMSTGLKLSGLKMVIYFDSNECDGFLTYTVTNGQPEKVEFKHGTVLPPQEIGTHTIPVIELKSSPFTEGKKAPMVKCIEAKDCWTIIKSVIAASSESGHIGKVYCFRQGAKRFIGSLNIVDEDGKRFFCYATMDADKLFSFFRYNYTEGKLEPTDIFGEHGFLYVKIVNLSEAFPFFKPD